MSVQLDVVMWPDSRWPDMRAEWQAAERLGLGCGWIYDHLFWQRTRPWHEAYATLAAVAASTRRIGMGTMVTGPNFRHPVTTAKAALTLDEISEHRFTLGLGAGGAAGDANALGGPPLSGKERAARFEEFVTVTDRLLIGERVTDSGAYFTAAADLDIGGGKPRRPRLAIAGTGPRGMALAARFADLWITQDISQNDAVYAGTAEKEIERQVGLLDRACADIGRAASSLPRLAVLGYGSENPLASIEAYRDCVGRYGALGISIIAVLWPRGDGADKAHSVLEQASHEPA
ncbi:LLM class flavin-dependent oxidoreductase [Nocardia sp. CDC160]|uniref:LLM class flavin-dependent oxidoreductase n=1 Tax=Nocardia sp. CDC160 TaxID=3112166 RepID=UPI002DB7F698|nr:LLM class flavin-dependent oxidoreductase [Nocardia sp. CDC160]MEC3915890.1 LLM class flavin-dependent oxidoreductase [Nocardia sp. CDC160]